MNIKQEIIDSINIIAENYKKSATQIGFGVVVAVGNNRKCTVKINGVDYSLSYYGQAVPTVNEKYPVFVPNNDMSLAFIVTSGSGGDTGTSDFNQLTNRPKYNGVAMTSITNVVDNVFIFTFGTLSDGSAYLPDDITYEDIYNAYLANKVVIGKEEQQRGDGDCYLLNKVYGTIDDETYGYMKFVNLSPSDSSATPLYFSVGCLRLYHNRDGRDGEFYREDLVLNPPSDNKLYGRRNRSWVEIPTASDTEVLSINFHVDNNNHVHLPQGITIYDINDAYESGKAVVGFANFSSGYTADIFSLHGRYGFTTDANWHLHFSSVTMAYQGYSNIASIKLYPNTEGWDGEYYSRNLVTSLQYNPISKTDAMTQEVGKDASGQLWTIPSGSGVEEVFIVPMSFYSDGTADLGGGVTMQDIHDAKEAGKLVVGEAYAGSTVLFYQEYGYGTSAWRIEFIHTEDSFVYHITFSQNRPDGHDGEVTLTQLVPEAPSDSKQYARRNRAWSEVQGGTGTSDYTALTNKPSINNVTLTGNKTLSDLGIRNGTQVTIKYWSSGDV